MNTLIQAIGFGLVTASIIAIASVGFTLQYGVTNVLNLAYGDTMTACAYIGYLVNQAGASLFYSFLAGAAFGGVFSVALNRILYRRFTKSGRVSYGGMIIVTLLTGTLLQNGLLAIFGYQFDVYKLSVSGVVQWGAIRLSALQLGIIILAIVCMAAVVLILRTTNLGRAMRATASNPSLARASGIRVDRIVDFAWFLSGILCGIAGVVLVINTISFESTTGAEFSIVVVTAAMLGGVGNATGAMFASLIVGIIASVTAAYTNPSYQYVFAFLVLIMVLVARPTGLFGVAGRETSVGG